MGSKEIRHQPKCKSVLSQKAELSEFEKFFILLDNCNLECNLDLPFARTMAQQSQIVFWHEVARFLAATEGITRKDLFVFLQMMNAIFPNLNMIL